MRKFGIIALIALVMTACSDDGEKKASLKLQAAEEALAQGNYNEAKLQLDSIKILYPKAFETRRKGLDLMQKVELKEQERTVVYLDSLLKIKKADADVKKKSLILEKNSEYQTVGNYLYPSQTVEKNINRTYLRAQVSEIGTFALTSIYCGGSSIHHRSIKVTAPDGSFAQTPASRDVYESTDLGMKSEKVDYRMGADGGVAGFIYMNKDQNIRLEYIGNRRQIVPFSPADRKAICQVYELAQTLSSINQIQKELDEAKLKIRFVNKKMEQESLGK
ncbi:hypothetical protein [uncultured Bacteroides sp.]|uniref:hypothetical protein n=1 Tax=uncultured Bacteroides sp. TaxID=162156 RepID=UPI002AABACD2|nr:hypothetical protein [uncultured Bacteroides sp.]